MKPVNRNQTRSPAVGSCKFNSNSGSVIIGAIVVTLFISIVAVFMLKSTKAHSSASVGYSSAMNMNMAMSSGVVATEWYFVNNESGALGALDSFMLYEDESPKRAPYIFGDGSGKKAKISGGQFFNSRLVDFRRDDPGRLYSQFEINSGKSADGRDLKSARAFYRVENVKIIGSAGVFGGKNAFYMNGQLNGNTDIKVRGYATFAGNSHIQFNSSKNITFEADDNGEGDVYFNSSVRFDRPVTFNTKAYFRDRVDFQSNGPNLFRDGAGFNGDMYINSGDRSIDAGGDVWINGKMGQNGDKIRSVNGSGTLNYTNNLPLLTAACPAGGFCSIHGVNSNQHNKAEGFDDAKLKNRGARIDDIQGEMGVSKDRSEPDLTMDPIRAAGKEFVNVGQINSTVLTAEILADYIKKNAGNEKNFYNGHLLVNVNSSVRFDKSAAAFNGKVIFVVDAGFDVNGNFYKSGPDASTLVYVTPNGRLNGMGSDGDFRGLIYVDEKNSYGHTFQWSGDGKVEGAVLFKGGNMNWNSGGGSATTISRNNGVLSAFAGLIKGAGDGAGGGKTAVREDGSAPVGLTPMGYYFY